MNTLSLFGRAIRAKPGLFLATFTTIMIGVLAGVYAKRPAYESTAKILVNLDSRSLSLSRAEVQYGGAMLQAVEVITSQVEILNARKLLDATVDSLGPEAFAVPPSQNAFVNRLKEVADRAQAALDDVLVSLLLTERISPRDKLIEQVSKSLRVYPVRQAQIIQVSFRWRTPTAPPLFLDRFLALYLETVLGLNSRGDGAANIDVQIKRAADDLNQAERERHALDAAYGIVDIKGEKQVLSARIDRLTALLQEGGAVSDAPSAGSEPAEAEGPVAGSQIASLRSQLVTLRLERAKAEAGYASGSRQVREIDGQIAAAESALATSTRETSETLALARGRLQVLQSVEASYNRVGRDIEIASEAFQTYRKAAEDRRLQMAEETKLKIQVVDPPTTPIKAVGWSRLLMAAAGLGFSLVLAATFVGVRAMIRSIVKDNHGPVAAPVALRRPSATDSRAVG